jgi:hypothetical protein
MPDYMRTRTSDLVSTVELAYGHTTTSTVPISAVAGTQEQLENGEIHSHQR